MAVVVVDGWRAAPGRNGSRSQSAIYACPTDVYCCCLAVVI